MFRNYFYTALRNLFKQPFYSLINILGLAIGVACCILILRFVQHELSYDRSYPEADRIYRLTSDIAFGENAFQGAVMPAPLAGVLKAEYPEVELAGRFRDDGSSLVRNPAFEKPNIEVKRTAFADPEVFDIFGLPLVAGEVRQGLAQPSTVAISRRVKELLFPAGQEAVGEMLLLYDEYEYKVVAVYEDLPDNSHFRFEMLFSMITKEESHSTMWLSHNFHTYILLAKGADPDALAAKFPDLVERNVGPQVKQFLGIDMKEGDLTGGHVMYGLQKVTDIHLHSNLLAEIEPGGDINYVYIFGAVALFILLIAAINFMNLSTARSAKRAREVGVRKVLGSVRGQIVAQFLVESVVITLIAFVLAVLLSDLFLPLFNNLSGKELDLPYSKMAFWGLLLLGGLIIGLLAGVYPAFFLSAFQPVAVLKGRLSRGASSSRLRSALVVFQFTTSVVLIVSTFVVYQQLQFVQDKKIGFNKEQVLLVENAYSLDNNLAAYKTAVKGFPEVENVTVSGFLPVSGTYRSNSAFWPEGNRTEDATVIMQNWYVDHDFVQTMGMEIVKGRDFSRDMSTDSLGLILNETAARRYGIAEDPLGARISTFTGDPTGSEEPPVATYTVIGVVKDFHFESLRDNIEPLGLLIGNSSGYMAIRVGSEDIAPVLEKAKVTWTELAPNQPFSYSFLDERFARMYESEQRVGQIFTAFAVLAIFVACLGLFALATYMAEQRTKEIGIRKVLGASVWQIVSLLSKDFMLLVGLSLVLALPLSFYLMSRWLEDFAYRMDLMESGPLIALSVGLLALLIGFATVSTQSWRAAHLDPVNSLKEE
ncbi:MAG: FtsX-like permease family protein [Bacteroidetes bacterium]|nr:MAG: FtsX-like permease family protein [Bacteroidota bacterium]